VKEEEMYWLVVAILMLAIHVALKVHVLGKRQAALAEFLEERQQKETADSQETEDSSGNDRGFAYGWFDDGWPVKKSRDEETFPLENPALRATIDAYAIRAWMIEYDSLKSAMQKRAFLRKLNIAKISLPAEFLDLVFSDESAAIRAWAAGHLPTCKDYSEIDKPVQTRDYEPAILVDPEPVVRAALWSNPGCKQLPFARNVEEWVQTDKWVHSDWKERLLAMSHIERLGLMRNPKLSKHLVLALLEASSEELGITRNEHDEIVTAAALNPALIGDSRFHGRDEWMVDSYPNPPCEEYAKMWDVCLDRWMGDQLVPYRYLSYIQTTPKKKLQTYERLNDGDGDRYKALLREAVIRSCDLNDKDVLKLACEDPDKECRKVARERVGNFTNFVGVS
jgi:hypothetical protein